MNNYNMKIVNTTPLNKNGCYAFSQKSIDNILHILKKAMVIIIIAFFIHSHYIKIKSK